MYFDQAEDIGPMLGLKVARRSTRLGPVPMVRGIPVNRYCFLADVTHKSGFQHYQLDRYLKMLVQDLNKQVAISDEVRNTGSDKTKSGGLLFDRKVTRIVTAGTLIDENFMDPYENNFLLAPKRTRLD
ncbi:hypothetical protein LTR28_012759 [Elasticomyces elasticus]|nr:hypothetical protein LTR28_012759 [Elasticomyces elasticus]